MPIDHPREFRTIDIMRTPQHYFTGHTPIPKLNIVVDMVVNNRYITGREDAELEAKRPMREHWREMTRNWHTPDTPAAYLGWWLRQHYRKLARAGGIAPIAKRLRKQGIPLHVALNILVY